MHQDTKQFVTSPLIIIFIILQTLFVLLLYNEPLIVIASLIGLIFLAITISHVEKSFFILLFMLLTIPSHGYNLPPFYFSISLKIVYPILVVILLALMAQILTGQRKFSDVSMKGLMIFFISYLFIAGLVGFANGNYTENIRGDFFVLLFFGLYFLIPTIVNNKKSLCRILNIFIIGTLVIAFEYLIIFYYGLTTGQFMRVIANQGLVFLFSIPLLICTIIKTRQSKIKRLLFLGLLILSFAGIAVTFTRGLWISLAIGITITLFLFHKEINKKYLFITASIILVSLIIVAILLAKRMGLDIGSFVVARASTILEFGEITSVKQRFLANQIAFEHVLKNPLFGYGLGKHIVYSFIGTAHALHWIDNSYLMLLLKLGIIGTIPFLLIITKTLIESIRIFKYTKDVTIKIFSGSMISFMVSWLILSYMSPVMIKYLLNIVWITLIALINCVRRLENENNDYNM